MAAKKKNSFTFFCTTCKQHYSYIAAKKKDAEEQFAKFGHETARIKHLRKGIVGYYAPPQD